MQRRNMLKLMAAAGIGASGAAGARAMAQGGLREAGAEAAHVHLRAARRHEAPMEVVRPHFAADRHR